MPLSNLTDKDYWNKKNEYRHELVTPYYYSVTFEYSENTLEFTPHERSGLFKLNFKQNTERHLRLGTYNNNGKLNIPWKEFEEESYL